MTQIILDKMRNEQRQINREKYQGALYLLYRNDLDKQSKIVTLEEALAMYLSSLSAKSFNSKEADSWVTRPASRVGSPKISISILWCM
jgi:hypothetical protein